MILRQIVSTTFYYVLTFLIALLFWGDNSNQPLLILFLLLTLAFLVFLSWRLWTLIKFWFWKLELTEDKIFLKSFFGKPIVKAKDDFHKYENQENRRIVLETDQQKIKLNVYTVETIELIILLHSLLNWMPTHLLVPSTQNMVEQRKNKADEVLALKSVCFEASRNGKRQWVVRLIVILVALGFLAVFIWLGLNGSLKLSWDLGTFLFLLVLFVFPIILISLAWLVTSNATIRVDDKGIHWQRRNEVKVYFWESIHAIRILLAIGTNIQIWQENPKGQKLTLTWFRKSEVLEIMTVLHGQAFARNIPTIIN